MRASASEQVVPVSLHTAARLNLALLGALALVLCAHLWPHWRHNPDLSHGFFTPLFSVFLLWESRRIGPARHPQLGNLVSFTLTAAFALAMLAGLVALAAEPLRVVSLAWPALVAVGLWLLSAPLPPGTYSTLSLRLQTWITGGVLAALHVFGVAARQQGNLIELAGTTVGVEEACSGVRSLISCVYAGLFFSALLVRRPWARALLVVLTAPLAIVMNFVRSLVLTLMANAGVEISGFWHEATGFAVLGVTALILAGLALILEPRGRRSPAVPAAPASSTSPFATLAASQALLGGALVLAAAVAIFFVVHTRPAALAANVPPDLAAMLPAAPEGWQSVTNDELYRFASALETDNLAQRTYLKGSDRDLTQITVYLAYWPAGRTSVSTVATHTPDACWPGVGWKSEPAAAARFTPVIAGRTLPAAEHRFFIGRDIVQHVWFWQFYDGAPITQRDPRSPRELLSLAWRYGFRKAGDQCFIRLSSNRPWTEIANEPLLAEIFTRLHPLGI